MKPQKKLNILLMILVILLISVVSFGGVYFKSQNSMINKIPDYKLAFNLSGYRAVTLKLSETQPGENAEVANEVATEETAVEAVATEENVVEENVVTDEAVMAEKKANYEKAAKIFSDRLKKLEVEDYTVAVDTITGQIEITIPNEKYTDTLLADLTQIGKFQINDTNSGETLITNDDIKTVNIRRELSSSTTTDGEPIEYLYMDINFNLSGTQKFKKLTKEYQNVVVEENVVENTTEDVVAEVSEEENAVESEEAEAKETPKTQVTLKIDETDLMTTHFSEINDTGTLTITVGNSANSAGDFETTYDSARNLAAIMENDPIPYQYDITTNVYVNTQFDSNQIKAIVCIEIAIALLVALVLIAKYRLNGVFFFISSLGFLALLLLAIRVGNVNLSFEGILAIEIAYLINTVFGLFLLSRIKDKDLTNKERIRAYRESMIKFLLVLIPVAIIVGIFTMTTNWASLNSVGLVLFYGETIAAAYNAIVSYIYIRSTNKD